MGARRQLRLSASVLAVLVWAIVITFLAFLPSRDGAAHPPVVVAAWTGLTVGQSAQTVAQGG